ncbi:MAG: ATP-binding protein [Bryobacteraceae bacterium]
MVRPGLLPRLRGAIFRAKEKNAPAREERLEVKIDGQFRQIAVQVIPLKRSISSERRFLVLFEDAAPPPADSSKPKPARGRQKTAHRETERLQQELDATKEYLQAVIEEQESTNEELKSANEEAQASNEELETTKEELQSANEELITLNDELRSTNRELTQTNSDLVNVLDGIDIPVIILGRDLRIRRLSQGAEGMFKVIAADIGRPITDLTLKIGMPNLRRLVSDVIASRRPEEREIQNDRGRWHILRIRPYQDPERKIEGALLMAVDVDEIKRSRDFADSIVDTVRESLLILDGDFRVERANRPFYETFQVSPEETSRQFVYDLGNGQWNIPKLRLLLEEILPQNSSFRDFEVEHDFPGIGRKTMLLNAHRLQWNGPQEQKILLAIEDVTHRHEALRNREALHRSEAQLRHLQKMEAVGRLAGGIAHDFNNLLTGIMGCVDLALDGLAANHPVRRDVEGIQTAAERAAALTSRLLAFSRRQVLQPVVLDLNAAIALSGQMLGRLIGNHIDLAIVPGAALDRVKADPGQIEQVIVNLALNARDAMPTHGKLTIETANVEMDPAAAHLHGVAPGQYVALSVTDTGSGMDKETQSHIFEPFFTTKAQGLGTGLGLSTVYGIVEQSGGHIEFHSEVGRGTAFTIYLPRAEEPVRKVASPEVSPRLEGSETVLLVEDEDMIRSVARMTLERKGYTVLAAAHGEEALTIFQNYQDRIHLMLTDVAMPGMNGRELADRLAPTRPDMKVLFMSGHTEDAVVHYGVLAAEMWFLQKPFTPRSLIIKVREVLDANS